MRAGSSRAGTRGGRVTAACPVVSDATPGHVGGSLVLLLDLSARMDGSFPVTTGGSNCHFPIGSRGASRVRSWRD
jgi:hypothetical protein